MKIKSVISSYFNLFTLSFKIITEYRAIPNIIYHLHLFRDS